MCPIFNYDMLNHFSKIIITDKSKYIIETFSFEWDLSFAKKSFLFTYIILRNIVYNIRNTFEKWKYVHV